MAALAFLTMTSSCASDEVQADTTVDPELQMELDRCEEACVKRTCNPLYEPEPNLLQLCSESCTEIVRDADDEECTDELRVLFECVNALSCDDYYSWFLADPENPCATEYQQFASACPGVELGP